MQQSISWWDDHKPYQKLSHDWLFQYVPIGSYIFPYVPRCIYVHIYIYTYTYYIYICITHIFPCFPVCSMYIPTKNALLYFDTGTGFNKTDLVAPSSGFRTLKRKNGGRSSKIPLRRLAGGGIPRLNTEK